MTTQFRSPMDGLPAISGRFAGDLSRFSVLDLAQTLMLARKTGLLTVKRGDRAGYFFFRNGEVVSVLDDAQRQGMQAALHLFLWKDGSFEFDFDKVPPEGNIGVTTENLLMEAARRLDEAARDDLESMDEPAAAGPDSGRTSGERQFDDLRGIFARIVDRAMPPALRARRGNGIDALLARMREEAAECLLLVPGIPPRLLASERVIPLESPPVSASDVERLMTASLDPRGRRELEELGASEGILQTPGGASLRAVATMCGGARTLSLHMPRPLLEFPAADPELEPLLGDGPGLFLVIGEEPMLSSDFTASAVAHLAASRNLPAAWFSCRALYRFPSESGLVVGYRLRSCGSSSLAYVDAALERGARILGFGGIAAEEMALLVNRVLDRCPRAMAIAAFDGCHPDDTSGSDPVASFALSRTHASAHRGTFQVAPSIAGAPFVAIYQATAGLLRG